MRISETQSKAHPVKSGTREVCPLSPYLFCIGSRAILQLKEIEAIKIGNKEVKILFSDDMIKCMICPKSSTREIFNFFLLFKSLSQPPLSSLSSPTLLNPSPTAPPFLLRGGKPQWVSPWASRHSKSKYIFFHWGPTRQSKKWGRGLNDRKQRWQLLLYLLQGLYEDQATHLLKMCRGSRSISCMFIGWRSRVCEPSWFQVI